MAEPDPAPEPAATFPLSIPVRFRPLPPAEALAVARAYPRGLRRYGPLEPPADTNPSEET